MNPILGWSPSISLDMIGNTFKILLDSMQQSELLCIYMAATQILTFEPKEVSRSCVAVHCAKDRESEIQGLGRLLNICMLC